MEIKKCGDQKLNCICSLNSKKNLSIEPLKFKSDIKKTEEVIMQIGRSISKNDIVEKKDNYFRFVCKTKFLRFRDDLEFEIDIDRKVVQIKSSSRLGIRDFGVNRKRLNEVTEAWNNI